MAKVKNTSNQPRGFMTEDGGQVVVHPGEEREFNMTEADFNKIKELIEGEDVPSFEISGSPGGVAPKSAKEQREADQKKREAEAKKREADQKAEDKAEARETKANR